jgi:hypothetical protein
VEEFMFSPPRTLRLERLETRDAPTSLGDVAMPPPPTASTTLLSPTASPTMLFIDPTLAPATPTATNVPVLILAVSAPTTCGYNVTVSGLTASNLQAGASLRFAIGGSTYLISSYVLNQDGTCRLTVANAPGLADALAQNVTATVIVGSGGNVVPPPAMPAMPPPPPPIIDTTLAPQG